MFSSYQYTQERRTKKNNKKTKNKKEKRKKQKSEKVIRYNANISPNTRNENKTNK